MDVRAEPGNGALSVSRLKTRVARNFGGHAAMASSLSRPGLLANARFAAREGPGSAVSIDRRGSAASIVSFPAWPGEGIDRDTPPAGVSHAKHH